MTTTDDTSTRPGTVAAADPFDESLRAIGAALDAVSDAAAWTLSEEAVVARFGEALEVRARVEELTVRLLGSITAREVPRLAGASSTHAWLRSTNGISAHDAARLVREAQVETGQDCLDAARVEPTRVAWVLGVISAEQAVLIAQTVHRLSGDVAVARVVRLQEDLISHAQTLSYAGLVRVCRHAVEVVDPDGADARLADQLERDERRALAGAELTFRRSGDGWTGFSGRLPDTYADLWKKTLDAYTNRRRQAGDPRPPMPPVGWDQAGPGCPLRGEVLSGDPARGLDGADRRTLPYPRRLGRAWCELLEHLPVDGLPKHGANTTTLLVTTTLDQLRSGLGEAVLDTGTAMSPAQVRRLACNAAIIPIVLGGGSAVLDLGLAQRLFDRHQRLALALRDGGCIWPACDRPPAWTEAHHITAWADGGPTDLANGCLLCSFHHHLVHGPDGWQIQVAPDGVPEVIPPARLDPERQPRRHERLTTQRRC